MEEKLYNFLKEYEALCKKYGFSIDACGCCDSPYILSNGDIIIENIGYNLQKECLMFTTGGWSSHTTIDEYFKGKVKALTLLDENDEWYTTCEYCGGKLYKNFICSECGLETECK